MNGSRSLTFCNLDKKNNTLRLKRFIVVLTAVVFLAGGLLLLRERFTPVADAAEAGRGQSSGPIIIIKGGTYTGNWGSYDTEVAAVEIRTAEPVIIQNATIRGAGHLIKSWGYNCNLTILNTKGYGLPPTPWKNYKKPRRFLAADVFSNVVVENCYLENTAGIYVGVEYLGNGTPAQTVKIRHNKARNIDGRIYGGEIELVQFVQFNFRNPIPHAEIAWNEVINTPDSSAVEDNINIYNTRGTPASPIRIHNNYIQGAYPYPSTVSEYSGGGIITDSPEADSSSATAYVKIYENQLIDLGNYCLGIAGGNNIEIFQNKMIVAAVSEDAKPYAYWTSGIWAKDYYNMNATYANAIHHNTIAVVGQSGTWRNDLADTVKADLFSNNVLQGGVTKAMERAVYSEWLKKQPTGKQQMPGR